jgi:hypothetical protein
MLAQDGRWKHPLLVAMTLGSSYILWRPKPKAHDA